MLGAIVSPTDPIAATAIAQRLGVPRKLVTIVEGESLVNDAIALVTFRTAVLAAATGSLVLVDGIGGFGVAAVGGVVVGVVVAVALGEVFRRLDDPPVEVALSLIAPFVAYLPAEHLRFSGVLAAVAAGIEPAAQFTVTGVACALASLVLLRGLEDIPAEQSRPGSETPVDVRAVLLPTLVLGVIGFGSFVLEGTIMDWGQIYLHDVGHAAAELAALAYLANAVGMLVSRLLGDRTVVAVGPVNLVRWSCVAAGPSRSWRGWPRISVSRSAPDGELRHSTFCVV